MTKSEKILQIANNNNGYITAKEVRIAKINSTELTRLVKENKLERISRGFYCTTDSFHDEYYKIQLKSKNCIYSHETALYFYDLSDRTPLQLDLTVPSGYNGSLRLIDKVNLHYIKKEYLELGLTTITTPFGTNIRIYDLERTICDIIKNYKKMDREIFTKALQRYSKSKNKDLNKLMRYAKKLNVDKKVREHMELIISL